jgi:hypothetical protein
VKSKDILVIDLKISWRVLALLGIVAGLSVLAYSVAVAQGGEPPITNNADVAPVADMPQAPPVTVPDAPEAHDVNLVFTTNGEWVARDSIGVTPSSALDEVGILSSGGGDRHVYLTAANYATNQVRTACASGYHMASLWELYDVSNLVYDYGHPAAYTKADSGYGPPSYWYGWVRTGYDSSSSSTTGTGNCNNWSNTSSSVYGVSARLSRTWETAPGDIGPWDATSFTCNFTGPVWCVKD